MKGSLEVLDGGFFTTIQDGGRPGFRKFGVPVSGVMDNHSYKLANWLVGNANEAPVLEMTMKGGEYEFKSDAVVAITGAKMKLLLNETEIPINKTTLIKKGDRLKVGAAAKGCRSYLAIQGKWNLEKVMGSYSTYTTAEFGGLKGRALKKGDLLNWESEGFNEVRKVPGEMVPVFASKNRIRILKGPEFELLNTSQQKEFSEIEFEVLSQSNRMGIRLQGKTNFKPGLNDMISSAVIPGTVQLPENGNPIILGMDGQSVGGYPRIAKVIDADLWRTGQLTSLSKVKFEYVTPDEAVELDKNLQGYYRRLEGLR